MYSLIIISRKNKLFIITIKNKHYNLFKKELLQKACKKLVFIDDLEIKIY